MRPGRAGLALGLAAAWGLMAPAPARAAEGPRPRAEAGVGYDHLTNGYAPWREAWAAFGLREGPRRQARLTARQTDRFGLIDRQLEAGVAYPFGDQLTLEAEGQYSPSAQVVPAWGGGLTATYGLPGGWAVGLGARHTAFAAAATTREALTLERYFGEYRAWYTGSLVQLPGAPLATAHLAGFGWYGDDEAALALIGAAGTEQEFVAPGRLLVMDVRAIALTARWPLAAGWLLTGEAGYTRQGVVYDRIGGRLGVALRW